MTLSIRVLRGLDECRLIRDDWARLVEIEGRGIHGFDVTASFEWAEAIWQGFLGDAPQIVLVAEDATGVRGLLPCSISAETIGGIRHRKLSSISSTYELRTGFLVGGDAEVLYRLLEYAFDHIEGWDTFVFRVVDDSLSDLAIRDVTRRRNVKLDVRKSWISPYISLPTDPTKVMASLKANMRSNVRRGEKQLNGLGKLEMRLYDSTGSVFDFLDLMEVVESRSWKLAAGTAMIAKQKNLYGIVTPAVAKLGWFLGAALMLDERPLAYIYGYAFAGIFVDEKESYDEQYNEYRPGNVLKAKFLEEIARRGIGIYDYAGEPDPHKARWTDQSYSRHIYILYNRTLRGWMVKASLDARKWWASLRRFFP